MSRLSIVTATRRTPTDPRVLRGGVIVSVDTSSSWRARVRLDGHPDDVDVPALQHVDLTQLAPGDVALLVRDRHRLVMIGAHGKPADPPPEPPPDPDPDPEPDDTTRVVTATVQPVSTGSARGGSWRTDTSNVIQGDWTGRGINTGAAWYGSRLSRLSGTCTRLRVQLRRQDGGVFGAQTLTMRLWAQSSPTGSPTSRASSTGPSMAVGDRRTVDLPASWGQQLLDGTAGGLGIDVGASRPYIVLSGRDRWASSFTVSLTYREG